MSSILRKSQVGKFDLFITWNDNQTVVKDSINLKKMQKQQYPIFLGGAGRSGTTLLRVILDSHPNICCGPEFRMTPTLANLFGSYDRQQIVLNQYGLDGQSVKEIFQNLFMTLTSRYRNKSGKPRFAEKTPGNCTVFPELAKILPESPFIHIIRDGRDVVASLRSQNWIDVRTGDPMDVTVDTRKAILHWKNSVLKGRSLAQSEAREQYYELYYEHLVRSPEKELRELFNFLKEPWDDSVLAFHKLDRNLAAEASAGQVTRPLYTSSISKYVDVLTHADGLIIQEEAGFLLEELGYCVGGDWIRDLE